jgi:hypothetical protein
VIFTTDNDVVTLSTRPDEKPTHWKQTIAILPNALDEFLKNDSNNNSQENNLSETYLNEDDKFKCFVLMNQLDDNPRNYLIDIGVDLNKNNQENCEDEDEDEDDDDEEHEMPCDCSRIKCVLIKATLERYENEAKSNK